MKTHITAETIIKALSLRHAKDVFVPECKDGPTWGASHLRLDAWVLAKSWSNPAVLGYEVKVNRQDFLTDDKWPGYLEVCNELYFASPKGLIQLAEVPADCGLVEMVGGSRLVMRKKAPHRTQPIPESVYRYILMSRATITRSSYAKTSSTDYWRAWLEQKADDRSLGYSVSKGIRQHVERVEQENRELKEINRNFDEIRQTLKRMGIECDRYTSSWTVNQRLAAMRSLVPDGFENQVSDLQRLLVGIRMSIEELKRETPQDTPELMEVGDGSPQKA